MELYSIGETEENIAEKLNITKSEVSYWCGRFAHSPPKKYIKDEKARASEILRLNQKKGKEYKEIIYLGYLRGSLTKEQYESAFCN